MGDISVQSSNYVKFYLRTKNGAFLWGKITPQYTSAKKSPGTNRVKLGLLGVQKYAL